MKNSTVAIEGFGKIGESVAKVLSEKGAKVIAISTLKGGIYNSKGLDVKRLSEIKTKYGEGVVDHYSDANKITKKDLLCLAVDILLPCAGPWTINSKNAHKVKAKIICPGANIPIAKDVEKILFNKKIISLPDFVTNSGGVLGSYMGSLLSEQDKRGIIENVFCKRVGQVIEISEARCVPPIEIAEKIAVKRFNIMNSKFENSNFKYQIKEKIKVMIPKAYQTIFIKPKAKKMFSQILSPAEQPFRLDS